MRWANVVEGTLFFIGFLIVCLVILLRGPAQPVPVRNAASTSSRRGIEG